MKHSKIWCFVTTPLFKQICMNSLESPNNLVSEKAFADRLSTDLPVFLVFNRDSNVIE